MLLTFWCFVYSVHLIRSEICISKYFKIIHGRRLSGTPDEKIPTQSITLCAMKCMQVKRCQGVNFINDGQSQHCELFNTDKVESGEITDDEQSVYYYAVNVEGNNKSQDCSACPTVSSRCANTLFQLFKKQTTSIYRILKWGGGLFPFLSPNFD